MRIAFDLDNTLIPSNDEFPIEKPKKYWIAKILNSEKLRAGTVEIFDFCKHQKWETWIYTTSFRSPFYIKRLFWLYNLSLDGIVNQEVHNNKVKVKSSKYPPTFGIDVIIDDSKGVKIEGEKYNFNAIVVQPNNLHWVEDLKVKLIELTNLQKQ